MNENVCKISEEYREALSELDEILNHSSSEVLNKIPKKFRNYVRENKSNYYVPRFDHSKRLSQLPLMDKTKELIAIIYMNFLRNEGQEVDYTRILNNNSIKKELELGETYILDNKAENKKLSSKK